MGNGRRCSSTTKKVAPPTAQNFTYDGTQKTGVLAGEGYTLSGTTTAIAAGNYTAVATLQSGYVWNDGTSNAKTISWSISALGISGASVSVPTQTYTGSALTPVPTVTLNGKALVYGTDFTCEWTNNTDAGTGYVKVIGKGNYSVETGTVAFTISQKSMAGISASVSGSFVYNGSGHTPDPVVKDGTTQLVKDRDYTLSYNNNVNAGTASVTITGKGIYTGSKTVNFKIDKASYGVSLVTTNADFSLFAKGDLHDFLIGSYSGTPTFTSSDLNVIKVNADGTYEVVGMGKATIRVSIPGGNNYYDFNAGVEKTVEVKDCFRIVGSDGTAKYYKTLAEAVAAVPANCTATISVIGSPKMDEGVTIDNGKNITLRGENGATLVRGDNFKDTAFSIAGGSLTIEDLTIDGNETVAHPTDSLIDVSGGKLTVGEGAVLVNNKVQGASGAKGGAIYADGGEVVIDGGSLTDNSANKGGAIAVEGDAVLTIKGGALEGNGVIGTGCSGGAIWVGGGAQVTIEDGDFQKNGTISGDGGAIYVEGGSLEIKGGTFEGNYAGFAGLYAQKGGAVAQGSGTVYLVEHNNEASGNTNGTITVNETIVVKGDIAFGTIERHVAADGVTVTYPNAGNADVTLVRGESFHEEMIRVEAGASLSLGGENGGITLDGGAQWANGVGPNVTDDGKGGAGTAVTGNNGITAHAPIIVNRGELNIADGATLQNNDNNYAKPGEGFGSENYGGGIRNEGAGELTMTGGSIEGCYSREGGAIMNVNKPGIDGYAEGGAPTVTVTGGTIAGNASQMKGSAIQTIYGGATTNIAGGIIEDNKSLHDLGSLSVEEGGKLTVSDGAVSAADGKENAIYIYNQYSDEDVAGAADGEAPYIEGAGAAQLVVSGAPTIAGDIHLDDPCEVAGKDTVYAPVVDASGYTGGEKLTVSVEASRPWGEIAQGSLNEIEVSGVPAAGGEGEQGFLYEEDGSVWYGGYDVDIAVDTDGGLLVTGSASLPEGEKLTVTIADTAYEVEVGEDGAIYTKIPASDLLYDAADAEGGLTATVAVNGEHSSEVGIDGALGDAVSAEDAGVVYDKTDAEDGSFSVTIDGKEGLEYNLVDKNGDLVQGAWAVVDENGKVTFEGLIEGEDYTLVARTPAQEGENGGSGTLPGAVTELGVDISAPADGAAKKEFEDAFADAVQDGATLGAIEAALDE